MASYHIREREPLLDQQVQQMLTRRGRQLLGLCLVLLSLSFGAMLASYSPNDAGWMVETTAPVQNLFGSFGAAVASVMMVILGYGSWSIALVIGAWGIRALADFGSKRAIGRLTFGVIAVAFVAVFAAGHAPSTDWPHAFGLGGLFGDTVLDTIWRVLPDNVYLGMKLLTVVLGMLAVTAMLFVTGFTFRELRYLTRMGGARLLFGLGIVSNGFLRLLGYRAGQMRNRYLESREFVAHRQAKGFVHDQALASQNQWGRPQDLRAQKLSVDLASLMPELIRRGPEAYAPSMEQLSSGAVEVKQDEHIKNRISAVIHARSHVTQAPLFTMNSRPGHPSSDPLSRGELAFTRSAEQHEPIATQTAFPQWQEHDGGEAETYGLPHSTHAPFGTKRLNYDRIIPELGKPDQGRVVMAPGLKRTVSHPSRQAEAEAQPRLKFDEAKEAYVLPPLSLLSSPDAVQRHQLSKEALEENARMLESVLDDYGVKGEIVSVRPGPVVTMYELEPAPGLRASRVIGLSDDIARSMSALSARVSTVPGSTVIGIELPNVHREKVVLREILAARDFGDSNMRLPLALGKDIAGDPIVANLAKMPHLLIAGTTGSGKSVAINTMILSLLYKLSPEECRMIMIDPKMLELSVYDGIPHLLSPVVTDPKKAVIALKWVVGEMEERYRKMSKMGVRNIEGYNGRVREALAKNEMFKRTIQTGFDEETGDPIFETDESAPVSLPYIVVIVDEMADLMMVAGKEIEACIQRLAQMARASGIHLIMATQRPSVDVITGTIKANFPTRISFQVTSKIDSRTILGEQGAEQLLGMGDMLYMAGGSKITRIHGPFVSDEEVEEIVTHLKSYGPPVYMSGVVEGIDDDKADSIDMVLGLGGDGSEDALYDQAVAIVAQDRKCSTSYIQRKLGIGYNKAAKLVEQMEDNHVVSTANHVGKREILLPEH
ncbi:MAG: S-DNA-T family DNA segregation ATPase FtsK/SpoIIIE [Paracoccaceae bacterium]|jgi:S-DNA-T family DNA segregation ATPase FtsK/SpoIIIE